MLFTTALLKNEKQNLGVAKGDVFLARNYHDTEVTE